jgi:hypothetical protein
MRLSLHFHLLKKRQYNENLAIMGMYGYHGQTCVVQTWVVACAFENLLGVDFLSKNALILL